MKLVSNLRHQLSDKKTKVSFMLSTMLVMSIVFCGAAFASGTGGDTSTVDYSAIVNALSKQINATQIAVIIGLVIANSAGICVLIWGAQKIVNGIQAAFKKGKIQVK